MLIYRCKEKNIRKMNKILNFALTIGELHNIIRINILYGHAGTEFLIGDIQDIHIALCPWI